MANTVKYIVQELSSNWQDRYWWRDRIAKRVNAPLQRQFDPNPSPINILDEDWDLLIVADACREDLFRETEGSTRFDTYDSVVSCASTTPEWLQKTFPESYGDIVYVTANPMVSLHKPNAFYKLVDTWRNNLDPETGIVPADSVTEDTLAVIKEHSDKRIVAHYMQPHFPFVRDEDLQFAQWRTFGKAFEEFEGVSGGTDKDVSDVWGAMERGYVGYDEVWPAYLRNVEYVMESIEMLIDSTDRRTIVTSDHGNLAGERMWPVPIKGYGHDKGFRQQELTRVPFGVVEATGKRPKIVKEEARSQTSADSATISERLESLGYTM